MVSRAGRTLTRNRGRAAIAALFLVALVVRIPGIASPPFDFFPQRQTYDALRARVIYLEGSHTLEPRKQAVLFQVRREVPQIEPPIMENLTAFGYRIAGAEHLWIPRMIAVIFWLAGGALLYKLAARLAGEPGRLISLTLYLFLPYGFFASRSFQPDPMMVMLTLAALFAVIRHHERPTVTRLAVACVVSAIAALSKPPIPIFFLGGVFLAVAITRHGIKGALAARASRYFAAVSLAPAALYYMWGTFVSGFLKGQTSSSFDPRLLIDDKFWKAWVGMVATVVAAPFNSHVGGYRGLLIDLVLASLCALGVLRAGRRSGVPMLLGLWAGYIVFGMAFTTHISTHSYYSLPLIPIVALSLAPVGDHVFNRVGSAPLAARLLVVLVCCLMVAGAALHMRAKLLNSDYRRRAAVYAEIGRAVRHTSAGADVDPFNDTPLLYYGWIGSWPLDIPEGRLLQRRDIQQSLGRIATESSQRPKFLIINGLDVLSSQPALRDFVRRLPIVKQTNEYAVFDLQRREGSAK